jgi:predicted chitinase
MADQVSTISGPEALSALVICGVMGVLGQGVRAVVGLKNAGLLNSTTPNAQSAFSAAYFGLSLMIGFIAGVLAGISMGLSNFVAIDPNNLKMLLGVAASGYLGADFVENAMSIVIPASPAPAAQPVAAPGAGATAAPAAAKEPSITQLAQPAPAPALPSPGIQADGSAELSAAMSIVCGQVDRSKWVPAVTAAFARFGLTTNRRRAAAMGQFLVEAGAAFQEVVENLHYSAERAAEVFPHLFHTAEDALPYVGDQVKFGNHVYANRLGNGDEASGDGYRFRGRGLIQLTGRNEYAEFGGSIGKSAEEAAQYCETVEGAAFSGCWYLATRDCLRAADKWDIDSITRMVNGPAMLGKEQRRNYSNSFLKHLGG